MRIWAATRDMNRILSETVLDFAPAKNEDDWSRVIGELCRELDLSRPLILKKHLNELNHFRHTTFLPSYFMESVSFNKFTVQLFPEKKNSDKRS